MHGLFQIFPPNGRYTLAQFTYNRDNRKIWRTAAKKTPQTLWMHVRNQNWWKTLCFLQFSSSNQTCHFSVFSIMFTCYISRLRAETVFCGCSKTFDHISISKVVRSKANKHIQCCSLAIRSMKIHLNGAVNGAWDISQNIFRILMMGEVSLLDELSLWETGRLFFYYYYFLGKLLLATNWGSECKKKK